MSETEAIVLGLIQGLTEFLPVSSSGHLTIFKAIFGIETGNLSFEVAVHAATVLSTIVAFRKQIWRLILGFFNFRFNPQKEYIFKIGVSMIPVCIVGVFFKDYVEDIFGSGLLIVGIMLLVTATLLSLSEILTKKQTYAKRQEGGTYTPESLEASRTEAQPALFRKETHSTELLEEKAKVEGCSLSDQGRLIGYKEAFIIGIAQAAAVLPGLSRSGSTISTGLMLGVKKSAVAQFSFLMVLIPILGEAFLELMGGDFSGAESGISALPLILGFITAFLSGLFACTLMISLVKKAKLWGFAIYCAIAGLACITFELL